MKKILVFSLFVVLLGGVSKTSAECELISKDSKDWSCNGGELSDLDKIESDARIIVIENMKVPKLANNTLKAFRNLARFQCSNCGVEEIDSGAFRELYYLQQLILDNNRLTTVKTDWFRGLRDLGYLDLSNNMIKDIEDEVYAHIPHVIDLRLSGNRIECIDTKGLANLKGLKRIYLAEIKTFKCPQAVSKFLKKNNITLEKDEVWDALATAEEDPVLTTTTQKPLPVTTTPLPYTTRPPRPEIPKSTETLAPKMETEYVDIPAVLTTNSLPNTPSDHLTEQNYPANATFAPIGEPKPVETSTEMIREPSTSIPQELYDRVTVTAMLPATTQLVGIRVEDQTVEPIEITPLKVAEIFYTPKPEPPPIQGPKVLPTPGEKPLEVEPLDNQSTDNSPEEYNTAPTYSSQNVKNGTGAKRVNEYWFGIIVATFLWSFL